VILERKVMGAIQHRFGPNVVGFFGFGQSGADGGKLFTKELLIPRFANTFIFLISPVYSFLCSLIIWLFLPYSSYGAFVNSDIGMIFLFAITSINVYGIIFGGWASNSKYAFFGALRSSAQMISYEVSLSLTLMPILLVVGSANLYLIVEFQENVLWFIFSYFPCGVLYMISLVAETNRAPFDLPEAEGELVAGYNVDFSSLTFALFFLAEYSNIIISSFLITIYFFGGWNFVFSGNSFHFEIIITSLKLVLFIYLFIFLRATFPRFRFSELMGFCWKVVLPLAFSFFLFYTILTIWLWIEYFYVSLIIIAMATLLSFMHWLLAFVLFLLSFYVTMYYYLPEQIKPLYKIFDYKVLLWARTKLKKIEQEYK
jgi:NADH:ubiquinone oxidoreductase subunit H